MTPCPDARGATSITSATLSIREVGGTVAGSATATGAVKDAAAVTGADMMYTLSAAGALTLTPSTTAPKAGEYQITLALNGATYTGTFTVTEEEGPAVELEEGLDG